MIINETILNNTIVIAIDNKFTKLKFEHKNILKESLLKLCIMVAKYIPFDETMTNEKYIEQLKQNDYQDIFSLLVLLLPYFELNSCDKIVDLGDLFYDKNKIDSLKSTYYVDHKIENDTDIITYFDASIYYINKTFSIISNKLNPNWLNIFPYTMDNYKDSDVYKQFVEYWDNSNFPAYDNMEYCDFKLGYHTMYGTIKSFLYDDIKKIKWMIYDLYYDYGICPTITVITEILEIQNIINVPWDKVDDKSKIINLWNNLTYDTSYLYIIKSLILFYLRWEKDNDTLEKLKLPKQCLKIIKTKLILDEMENENKDETMIENILYNVKTDDEIRELEFCLNEISKHLSFEKIYKYIYDCCQQFKYTWYGYICLNENKMFLNKNDFLKRYVNENNSYVVQYDINDPETEKHFVTPKTIYNFFKSFSHITTTTDQGKIDKFYKMSNFNSWDNLVVSHQGEIIKRLNERKLNGGNDFSTWFNIRNNVSRLYFLNKERDKRRLKHEHDKILEKIRDSKLICNVIFECLVYNGILTYFKYNPEATNKLLLPDKNKENDKWKQMILSKVSLEPFREAYHFLDNKQYGLHDNLLDVVKKSLWYTNFGADWICQIQVFHHFIHQRVLFVTGAPGAGKSTVYPFMILYATKIINYNNNGKVLCTVPRIKPARDNATRMASSLGMPIKPKLNSSEKPTGEYESSDINFIQYQYKGANVSDDLYHPTLKLLTDGLLYQLIKNNYIFKIKNETSESNKEPFIEKNLFDVLLIDESHEHNPYMDIIMTLSKFAIYMNNQITLGIISATMDDDEATYRKFFEPINDDYKSPIVQEFPVKEITETYDIPYFRNMMDRRIHLSVPFGGMNFTVEEKVRMEKKDKEIDIINEILSNSKDGDILIFKPGKAKIENLIEQLNNEIGNIDVIAIPFMSELDPSILSIVENIDKQENRNKFRYDKKKYTIYDINNIPEKDKLPVGTYKRFIIVATNIAEASVTIDSLKYIIDDGQQNIRYYDFDKNQSKLITEDVSKPNKTQRKGRIGRVKPGTAYFTYDINKLNPKVIYKLCSDNINDKILDLIELGSDDLDIFKFTDTNNPYLISNNENNYTTITRLPKFLQNQYSYINSMGQEILFYYRKDKPQNIDYTDIVYPDGNGKYSLEILKDNKGKFYIIHPNETDVERNMPYSLDFLNKPHKNKVEAIVKYLISLGLLNERNIMTPYGKLVLACFQLLSLETSGVELTILILSMLSFKYSVINNNVVFNNIIWFCVFLNNRINIKLPETQKVYSDFLEKSKLIPSNKLNILKLSDIIGELKEEIDENFDIVIRREVNKIVSAITMDENVTKEYQKMMFAFYTIKIKIEILEELMNPYTTMFYDSKRTQKIGQINKNCKILKNINMSDLNLASIYLSNLIKTLNNYEQICFFICRTMKSNLLLKIEKTPYYINYFDRQYSNVHQIAYSPYKREKLFTNVYSEYRNNVIFYLTLNSDNSVSEIMWIPIKIINLIKKIYKIEINRNNTLDKKTIEKMKKIHGDEFNIITQKIDIINEYIVSK